MRNIYTPLKFGFLFIMCLSRFIEPAKAQNPVLVYEPVLSGLTNPIDAVVAPGDGRMFIAQQNGLIRIRNGATLTTFANLGPVLITTGNEQGLLSLAFHPDYATNRYFFVLYTAATTGAITLARYRRDAADPNAIEPGGTVLLSIPKPGPLSTFSNHNGGKIIFGTDGYLYMSTGDGGGSNDPNSNGQNRGTLLGKMLRLDVNSFATTAPFYDIPPTNPYISTSDGFLDEIYSYGLRNPWRWSFDRTTGDMWIGDVGQMLWEEVDWTVPGEASGANFGWRCYEGAHVFSGGGCSPSDTISPIFEYGHNNITGGFSITGGYVYRGSAAPAMQGFYIVTDYITGNLWKIRPNGLGGWQVYFQDDLSGGVSGFAEGPTGELYAINRGAGRLDSVVVASLVPVTISNFSVSPGSGFNTVNWTTAMELNTSRFYIEYSTDAGSYTRIGSVNASGGNNGHQYNFRHNVSQDGYVYYRLAIEETDGSVSYSNIVRIKSGSVKPVKVYPTIVNNGQLNVELNQPAQDLQLLNTNGAAVLRKNLQGVSGNLPLLLPVLPKGVYILQINGPGINFREKIIIQ